MSEQPRANLPPTEISATSAARGGLVTIFGQVGRLIILLANLAVLGRLLSPTDFGLVALAFAIVGIAELLRDLGLSAATIQAPTLSQEEKTNLFWLNSLLGCCLGLGCAIAAAPIAMALDTPQLANVIWGMAIVFLLNGIGTQFQAQLSRDFRFGTVVATDLLSQALGLAVGVGLAVHGAGYWALVGLQVTVATSLLGSRIAVTRWRPGLPTFGTSIRSHVAFGFNLGAAQVLGFLANSTPNIALGAWHSPFQVGLFSRAFQFVNIPINQLFGPLTNVALSILAKLGDPSAYRRTMQELALLVTAVGIVSFTFTASLAHHIVPFLFGERWVPAIRPVQFLAAGACFQALTYPYYWAFLSLGRTRDLLRYNLVTKTGLGVLALIGATRGHEGAAIGFACGLALSWPVCVWWLRGERRIDGRAHVRQSSKLLLAGISATAAALVAGRAPFLDSQPAEIALSFGAWASFGAITYLLLGGRNDLIRLSHLGRRLIGRA